MVDDDSVFEDGGVKGDVKDKYRVKNSFRIHTNQHFPNIRTQAHTANSSISRFQQKYFFCTVCNYTVTIVKKVKSINELIKKKKKP